MLRRRLKLHRRLMFHSGSVSNTLSLIPGQSDTAPCLERELIISRKNSRAKNGSEDKKTKAKNEVDELLTIRGLMNRIETDKIIDSPRDYQLELFERAKKENTIAVLDTGTGKTLIAVLLLKHILEQELASRALGNSQRLAFFVVDVSTLVYQQFAVLEHNLDQPIDRFCGEMNIDSWDKGAWAVHFEKNMAIVCTADVLYNCLSRGFITIERINLLIFDEAHHTKKNHAYARYTGLALS